MFVAFDVRKHAGMDRAGMSSEATGWRCYGTWAQTLSKHVLPSQPAMQPGPIFQSLEVQSRHGYKIVPDEAIAAAANARWKQGAWSLSQQPIPGTGYCG